MANDMCCGCGGGARIDSSTTSLQLSELPGADGSIQGVGVYTD